MKSIPVNGQIRLYDEEGEGPPVIPIHGSLSSSRQWRSLTDRLRGHFRVISPDLLACEQKDGALALGAFTFAQDCAFIEKLIAVNPGAHLLGHSYGGVVAIKAALVRQDKLASLILIEPSCFQLLEQEKQPEHREIVGIRDAQHAHEARGEIALAARGFIEYWIGPDAWTAMPDRRKELMALGVPKLNEDWPGTLDHNTRLTDYRKLALPVLLMRAKDTRRPSYKIVDLIRAELPNATFAEVSSGGHMSPLTNSEPVNDAVERFLVSLPSATP